MQLVMILVVVVSILTVLSGISVIAGSNKKERGVAIWFLLIAITAAIWSISVGIFLRLTSGQETSALPLVQTIFMSSIFTLVALVGNTSWHYKIGKIITTFLGAIGIILSAVVICSPESVFLSTEVSTAGNTVYFNMGFFSILYGVLILFSALIAATFLFYHITHARKRNTRSGYLVYLVGIAITITCSVIFDLMLPLNGCCALMWIGPVTVAATMLGYYYAILRYRLMVLSSAWMKIMSYIILMASSAVVYMIIFFVVFMALFRGARPSAEVILLNFIMILIVLLLMPALNEINAFVKSLTSIKEVDISYIVSKLNQSTSRNVSLASLSAFLAEHMHFEYIGFLIDDKLYTAADLTLTSDEIRQISRLKSVDGAVWQEFNVSVKPIMDEHSITAVAELRDAKSKTFGHMIVGKPVYGSRFESHDLEQLEMIINLVALIIDSKKKSKILK